MTESPTTADPGAEGLAPQAESGLLSLLCLYLVLLAFFILLNSMAQPSAQRSSDVIHSVREAFDRELNLPRPVPLMEDAAPDSEAAARVLAGALSGVLGELAPQALREDAEGSPMLRLNMDAGLLFEPEDTALRPERAGLPDAIATALTHPPLTDFHVEVEVLHGVETLAGAEATPGLAVARAGGLVRALADQDLPADRLAVGVAPEQAGRFLLVFHIYAKAPPAFDPAPLPGARP